jgi:hypothetical protein
MMVSTTAAKAVTTAGIALLVCFLISRLLLINSSFDTGRGLALGAVSGSIGLTLLWFVVAVVAMLVRLGRMPWRFWAVLALDGFIVGCCGRRLGSIPAPLIGQNLRQPAANAFIDAILSFFAPHDLQSNPSSLSSLGACI